MSTDRDTSVQVYVEYKESDGPHESLGRLINRPRHSGLCISDDIFLFRDNATVSAFSPVAIVSFWSRGGGEIANSRGLSVLWTILSNLILSTCASNRVSSTHGRWDLGDGYFRLGQVPVFPDESSPARGLAAMITTVLCVGRLGWGSSDGHQEESVESALGRIFLREGVDFANLFTSLPVNFKGLDDEDEQSDAVSTYWGSHESKVFSKTENLSIQSTWSCEEKRVLNGHWYAKVSGMMVGNWENWVFAQTLQVCLLARFKSNLDFLEMNPEALTPWSDQVCGVNSRWIDNGLNLGLDE